MISPAALLRRAGSRFAYVLINVDEGGAAVQGRVLVETERTVTQVLQAGPGECHISLPLSAI